MHPEVNAVLRLVSALNDPLRLAIVRYLMGGPAGVSELIGVTGAAQSKVSNHLAILRESRVVVSERLGRRIQYSLATPAIASVVEALESAGGHQPEPAGEVPEIALARTCYDHIAGRLGVAIFGSLVQRRALFDVIAKPRAAKVRSALGEVRLGPAARTVFDSLNLDLDEVEAEKRQFAAACNDWTESQPHLGGALGAALQRRLLARGWVQRRGGSRSLRITPAGRIGFLEEFAIDVAHLIRA
jgi:DNA-binding transcriptional ArsR family regulator